MQLAYNGRPLYLFAGDSAPGQTFGDGLNAFGRVRQVMYGSTEGSASITATDSNDHKGTLPVTVNNC